MGMWIGRNRKARVTYGFDEIALAPGEVTINPNEVDISFVIPGREGPPLELKIPILASASGADNWRKPGPASSSIGNGSPMSTKNCSGG